MYTNNSASPILMLAIGAGIVVLWFFWSDPETARQVASSRSVVDWITFVAIFVGVFVAASMAVNVFTGLSQVFIGVLKLGLVAAALVALFLLVSPAPLPAGIFDEDYVPEQPPEGGWNAAWEAVREASSNSLQRFTERGEAPTTPPEEVAEVTAEEPAAAGAWWEEAPAERVQPPSPETP